VLSKANATSGKKFVKKETHPRVASRRCAAGDEILQKRLITPVEVSVALSLNCVARN
jgi:hypothetical protein